MKIRVPIVILTIIFSILLPTISTTQITSANPTAGFEWHLDPPIITIVSPLNETYTSKFPLNFTITAPDSWLFTPVSFSYEVGSGLAQKLISVTYAIDGEIHESFFVNSNLSIPFNYCTDLSNMTVGKHELMIWANATGVFRNWISSEVKSVPISSIASINFTIVSDTPKPTLSTEKNAPHLELTDYLLPVSVILAVIVVLSLLLFRRHRKTIKS